MTQKSRVWGKSRVFRQPTAIARKNRLTNVVAIFCHYNATLLRARKPLFLLLNFF